MKNPKPNRLNGNRLPPELMGGKIIQPGPKVQVKIGSAIQCQDGTTWLVVGFLGGGVPLGVPMVALDTRSGGFVAQGNGEQLQFFAIPERLEKEIEEIKELVKGMAQE